MADPTPTLDATVGGTDSNSYVTLAEANTYFGASANNGEWDSNSDPYKQVALIQATQWLDPITWSGKCCSDTQRLNWPRKEVTCFCREAVCTIIPLQVKQATFELALKLAANPNVITGGTEAPDSQQGSVRRNKLGDLEQEFFEYKEGESSKVSLSGPAVLQRFPFLVDMLGCWYAGIRREIRLYRN